MVGVHLVPLLVIRRTDEVKLAFAQRHVGGQGQRSYMIVQADVLNGGWCRWRIVAPRGQIEVVARSDELIGVGHHRYILDLLKVLGREFHQVGVVGILVVAQVFPCVAHVDIALTTGDALKIGTHFRRLRSHFQRQGVNFRHFARIGRHVDSLAIGAEFARSGHADGLEGLHGLGIDHLHSVFFLRGNVQLRTAKDGIVGRSAKASAIGCAEHIAVNLACCIVEIVE